MSPRRLVTTCLWALCGIASPTWAQEPAAHPSGAAAVVPVPAPSSAPSPPPDTAAAARASSASQRAAPRIRASHRVDVIAPGEKVETIIERLRQSRPAAGPPETRGLDRLTRPPGERNEGARHDGDRAEVHRGAGSQLLEQAPALPRPPGALPGASPGGPPLPGTTGPPDRPHR